MHEHKFKRTHRAGKWRQSPDAGLLMAYDEWLNVCECGEAREIKTHPRGIWWKASAPNIERIKTYPERWFKAIRNLIANKLKDEIDDITFSIDSIQRIVALRWDELDSFVNLLLKDGVIEKFEPYPKGSQKETKIIFRADNLHLLKNLLGLDLKNKQKETIDNFFESWEYPDKDIPVTAIRIVEIINNMKRLWEERGKPIVTSMESRELIMKSLSNYILLLETLREISNIAISYERLSMRELSVRLTGDSKGLEGVKSYLRTVIGDLNPYGITEHSSLLFCKLPLIGKIADRTIDLSACADFVSMTSMTAGLFKPLSSGMRRIVLVENLTPFERLARESERFGNDTGILFLSGYPPGFVRDFVKRLLKFRPIEGLIWCDLDPDGIEIALNVGKWFEKSEWNTLFMEKDFLLSSKTKPLSEADFKKLNNLKNRNDARIFHPLINKMEELGVKVEQESQLLTTAFLPQAPLSS